MFEQQRVTFEAVPATDDRRTLDMGAADLPTDPGRWEDDWLATRRFTEQTVSVRTYGLSVAFQSWLRRHRVGGGLEAGGGSSWSGRWLRPCLTIARGGKDVGKDELGKRDLQTGSPR